MKSFLSRLEKKDAHDDAWSLSAEEHHFFPSLSFVLSFVLSGDQEHDDDVNDEYSFHHRPT